MSKGDPHERSGNSSWSKDSGRKSEKGSLASVRPDDLGALVVKETLKRAGNYEGTIDDLIIGCAMPEAEQGLNMARNIGALAGLPYTVPAITINRYCSSGLQSIAYGAERIMLGQSDTVIAGGAESMSLLPMMGHVTRPNARLAETAPEYYMGMGHTAEAVAKNTAFPVTIKMHFPLEVIKRRLRPLQKESFPMRSYRLK